MKEVSKDQLWEYVEGGLSGPEKAAIEQWLAADAGNRRQLNEIRSMSDGLRSMETDAPPMRFATGVMEAWDRELALRTAPLHTRTDKRIVYAIAVLLAGASLFAFGLLVAVFAGNSWFSGQSPVSDGGWFGSMSDQMGRLFAGAGRYFTGMIMILIMVLLERCIHYRRSMRAMQ